MSSNNNNSDKNGLWLGLIILLVCVGGFIWWYFSNEDDPDRQKLSSFINEALHGDSDNIPIDSDVDFANGEYGIELSGTCYHYQQLSTGAKQVYKFIYRGCKDFQSQIPLSPASVDDCDRAIYAFRLDHPEYYWMRGSSVTVSYVNDEARSINCEVPRDAVEKMNRIESIADEVLKGAPKDEYGKVQYIYEYIINNTDYDIKDMDNPENQLIYRTLVDHMAVCGGYANTFLYLCDRAGIYSGYVSGEVEGRGPHAWNFVKIFGKYYWVDVTWGDPVFEGSLHSGSSSVTDTMSYDYFCVSDDEILPGRTLSSSPSYSSYQPYMNFTYPACTDDSCNYYKREGCYFKGYTRMVISDYIMTQVGMLGNRTVTLKFDTKEAYELAKADIFASDDFINGIAADLRKDYGVEITQQYARMSDEARRLEIEFS